MYIQVQHQASLQAHLWFNMNITDGDIKFFYDSIPPADIQVVQDKPDLFRDPGFETAVIIMLMTDTRASDEDVLPDKNDTRQGWWADALTGTPIGSKIWLLRRSPLTGTTLAALAQYTRDALQPLIDEGIADNIETSAERAGLNKVKFTGKIIRVDNSNVFFQFFNNWNYQISGRL